MMKALRNRKAIILIVSVLILAVVFTAVYFFVFRESRDEYGFIRKSVSKAAKEASDVIGNTYENFTLPDSIDITCGDTLYDMTEYRIPEDNNVDAKERCMDLASTHLIV